MERPLENADERVDDAIRTVRRVLAAHPEATQAAFAWLVREGRAYAQTTEGAKLLARIVGSEYVTRLRTAWEILSCGTEGEDMRSGGPLPSAALDAVVRAVFRRNFEVRLHDAMRARPGRPRGEEAP